MRTLFTPETNRGDIKFQDSLCLLKRFQRKGTEILISVEMKRHLKEHVVMYYSTSARQGFFVIFWDIQLIDTLVFIQLWAEV